MATAGSSPPTTPSACSRPRAAWCSATYRRRSRRRCSRTPTARRTTSPASATRAARWSGSCPIPSAPPTRCSACPTASGSSRPLRPGGRALPRSTCPADDQRETQPQRGRILRQAGRRAAPEATPRGGDRRPGSGAADPLHEVPEGRLRPHVEDVPWGPDRDLPALRRHVGGRRRDRGGSARASAGPAHPRARRRVHQSRPAAAKEAVVTGSAAAHATDAHPFPGEPPVTPELVREHNLNELEYGRILDMLGRTPTLT